MKHYMHVQAHYLTLLMADPATQHVLACWKLCQKEIHYDINTCGDETLNMGANAWSSATQFSTPTATAQPNTQQLHL
jgi:hypothetical protein